MPGPWAPPGRDGASSSTLLRARDGRTSPALQNEEVDIFELDEVGLGKSKREICLEYLRRVGQPCLGFCIDFTETMEEVG